MAGEREQIELACFHIDGNFSGGLHGVGVEVNFGFRGDAADFLERLNGAEFVVGVHHGDQTVSRIAEQIAKLSGSIEPSRSTGRYVTATPCFSSAWQVLSTASCSIAVVMMCW